MHQDLVEEEQGLRLGHKPADADHDSQAVIWELDSAVTQIGHRLDEPFVRQPTYFEILL